MFEPAQTYTLASSPEPSPEELSLEEQQRKKLYPLVDRLFCDDGASWRASDLSDDYLSLSLDVYKARVADSLSPSMADKERLRALEQEKQRRRMLGEHPLQEGASFPPK